MSFLEKDKQLNIFYDQLFNIYINWMNRKKLDKIFQDFEEFIEAEKENKIVFEQNKMFENISPPFIFLGLPRFLTPKPV
jgi:hypothetical protein